MQYVRFRSRFPNAAGLQVGVFGLVNVLGRHGMLTPDEERFRRENNAWYDAAYPDPCTVDPAVYDPDSHPGAAAWFKAASTALIARIAGYLDILDAHRIAWEEVRTTDPGTIIYEDQYQIVATPGEAREHAGRAAGAHVARSSPRTCGSGGQI